MPATVLPSAPAPPRYIAGDLALDFVNTAAWGAAGPYNERLVDYPALTRWAEGAGSLPPRTARRLRRRAAAQPAAAAAVLARARALRLSLMRIFRAVAAGRAPGPELARLDAAVRAATRHRRLTRRARAAGAAAAWEWAGGDARLDAVLWPVALAGAALLTSEEAARVRVCGGEDCGWVFVDRSRNGLRRWCEMEVCGTRAKSRRRAARRAAS
jgi:predicted RNA-binding Zn ribbon-like protein